VVVAVTGGFWEWRGISRRGWSTTPYFPELTSRKTAQRFSALGI